MSEGYILPKGDDLAEAEVRRLVDIAKGPDATLALYFDEEAVPPMPLLGAGSYYVATPSSDVEATSVMAGDLDPEDATSPL